ncbi:FAD-dependent oxidoreductase [Dyella caseinilytica]|uniref:D-amino-acid oxidase n=1 Tax=Dyella caseinilytica TaxID=1849581 RepID=A0ABX7GWG9_9GAMM|nr:FAD-dependent oxidoreductase [Dyella caseinilytica]QRN54806.1 FAD-binding oxidoreductase [Dyella caseinilytica]
MQRREFLRQAGATLAVASTAALAGCARQTLVPAATKPPLAAQLESGVARLAPIRAQTDRITGIYVCTRPFRAAGPRIEMETLGNKTIVHNYGHGGSGWSLSWGSSTLALHMAQSTGVHELGVIGCGALGLTSALLAQRAGLSVRIYAKALPPDVFSMRATGLWTPDSRICDAQHAQAFGDRWETMARTSYGMYQSMLGLPGDPIEWIDGYHLPDMTHSQQGESVSDEPDYGDFSERIRDLTPETITLPVGSTPFPQPVRRFTIMMFNITTYARMLMSDFQLAGGKIIVREFTHPRELQELPERTLINATGYGARALFSDDSIIPVRGQTARLIPQPEVNYALSAPRLNVVPRRDGLLVQAFADTGSFNNSDLTPHPEESEAAVRQLAGIMASMRSA